MLYDRICKSLYCIACNERLVTDSLDQALSSLFPPSLSPNAPILYYFYHCNDTLTCPGIMESFYNINDCMRIYINLPSSNCDLSHMIIIYVILHPFFLILAYMQVPATIMNVVEEMSLKDTRKVNLFYLLFWTSLYQVITIWLFFWVDILPGFGYAANIHQFGEK